MKYFILLFLLDLSIIGYGQTGSGNTTKKQTFGTCTDGIAKASIKKPITCKLTSLDRQQRKATVIASLKKKIRAKKELLNGFAYQFSGSDAVVDELTNFVKTERLCCDFFDFNLSIKGDGTSAWLTITGPNGTKGFIKTELEL